MTAATATVQAFFTERLARQRRASAHTISAYRDTLRLLLNFVAGRTGTSPCRLDIADLNAPVIAAFLDHLEHDRGNSVRTRNARLAAIHSLFTFAALRHPEHAADIDRVLAIPPKRADQTIVTFLTDPEAQALLAARTGRRDHAWILLAIQTGLRASELTGLTCGDVHLGTGAYVACHGKGRKDRITPLAPETVTTLRTRISRRVMLDLRTRRRIGRTIAHNRTLMPSSVHSSAADRAWVSSELCPAASADPWEFWCRWQGRHWVENTTPHLRHRTSDS